MSKYFYTYSLTLKSFFDNIYEKGLFRIKNFSLYFWPKDLIVIEVVKLILLKLHFLLAVIYSFFLDFCYWNIVFYCIFQIIRFLLTNLKAIYARLEIISNIDSFYLSMSMIIYCVTTYHQKTVFKNLRCIFGMA